MRSAPYSVDGGRRLTAIALAQKWGDRRTLRTVPEERRISEALLTGPDASNSTLSAQTGARTLYQVGMQEGFNDSETAIWPQQENRSSPDMKILPPRRTPDRYPDSPISPVATVLNQWDARDIVEDTPIDLFYAENQSSNMMYYGQKGHNEAQNGVGYSHNTEDISTSVISDLSTRRPIKTRRLAKTVSHTISRDRTAGEEARQSALFASFPKKKIPTLAHPGLSLAGSLRGLHIDATKAPSYEPMELIDPDAGASAQAVKGNQVLRRPHKINAASSFFGDETQEDDSASFFDWDKYHSYVRVVLVGGLPGESVYS